MSKEQRSRVKKEAGRPVAIYHRVYASEGFDEAAQTLFRLVQQAQRTSPGAERMLYLTSMATETKRNEAGAFDEVGDERRYGYFYYLVEAENIQEAGDRLRREISRMRQRSDLFDRAVKIYVDHFVEVTSLPKRGLLGRYQSFQGEAPPVLFAPVPPGSARGVQFRMLLACQRTRHLADHCVSTRRISGRIISRARSRSVPCMSSVS
jgi:hypothetical protein